MEQTPINLYSGLAKYDSYGGVKVDAFRADIGIQEANTYALKTYKKGTTILSFVAKVVEDVASAGAATVQLGFTGKTMLSAAIAKATLVTGYMQSSLLTDTNPYVLLADDSFDSIVAVATLTAGKYDVYIVYLDPPTADLGSETPLVTAPAS